MTTKIYSAIDHAIYLTTYNDVTFKLQGPADGDFISVSFDNDAVSKSEGAHGDVQFSQRKASMGTIVWTDQWGSLANDHLNQVFRDQQGTNYIKDLQVKRISNEENVTIWKTTRAMIQKVADYVTGTSAQDRAWSFAVEGLSAEEFATPV